MVVAYGLYVMALVGPADAAPLGSEFTYQGQLKQGGLPVNGPVDLEFSLWDAAADGATVAPNQTKLNVNVVNGLFKVDLDFGANAFTGADRWLQIAVRSPAGVDPYITLSTRQPLTAAPYSLFSLQAGNTHWQAVGNDITNTNSGFVGINRSTTVSGAEYFGIQAPAIGTNYGGMYIRTDSATARPFYGYNTGTETAWTYLDGADGSWNIYNGGIRMTVGDNGRVGIGTTTPAYLLDVDGRMRVREESGGTAGIWFYQTTPAANRAFVGMYDDTTVGFYGATGGSWDLLMNTTTGNVGIKTANPQAPLHIVSGSDAEPGGGGVLVLGATNSGNLALDGNEIMARDNGAQSPLFLNNDGGNVHIAVASGGVSIGTTTIPSGVLLAVDGKVLCEEMEVQLSGDWPDFVFAEDYPLMPLDALEQSIVQNGHLPGIPAAAEVAARGMNVGKMQAQTLQKVEELTLYVIEVNKQVQAARAENQQLRERIAQLEGGQ